MVNVNFYSVKLVKETAARYDVDNKIDNPTKAYNFLKETVNMEELAEENMYVLFLNVKNVVLGVHHASKGSLDMSIVHPREIFKSAILCNSARIIIAHNHPSGDVTPSREDESVTKRLREAGKIIGIEVTDHLIIGDNNFLSMKEKGLL